MVTFHTPGHPWKLPEPVCNELSTPTLCFLCFSLLSPSLRTNIGTKSGHDRQCQELRKAVSGGTFSPLCWEPKSESEMVKFGYWQLRSQLLGEALAHAPIWFVCPCLHSPSSTCLAPAGTCPFYGNYWFSCLSFSLYYQFHEVRNQVLFSLIFGAQKMFLMNAWHCINCPNIVQQVLEWYFFQHCFIISLMRSRKKKWLPARPLSV